MSLRFKRMKRRIAGSATLAASVLACAGLVSMSVAPQAVQAAGGVPDSRIAFVKVSNPVWTSTCGHSSTYQIVTADMTGGGNQQVVYTVDHPCESVAQPVLSPDRTKIAFTQYSTLKVLDLVSLQSYWMDSSYGCGTPAWSPDGKQLVCGRNGNTDTLRLYDVATATLVKSMDLSGKGVRLANSVDWLPNGEGFIVAGPAGGYSCDGTLPGGMWRVGLDEAVSAIVAPGCHSTYDYGISQAWLSPDKTKIAYLTVDATGRTFRTVNIDGTNDREAVGLAGAGKFWSNFAWTLDSKALLSTVGVSDPTYPTGNRTYIEQIDLATGRRTAVIEQNASYNAMAPSTAQSADTIAPTVTGTVATQPNTHGWYREAVTINWIATDPAPSSGGVENPAPTVADNEGVNQYVSGQACDAAGNCATGQLTVSIDKTVPTVSVTGVEDRLYFLGETQPAPTCETADALSGVAKQATATVTGGNTDGSGTFTATCAGAEDKAGNVAAPVAASWTVYYDTAGGFTGGAVANVPTVNEGKAGRVYKLSWQLKDANGGYVSDPASIASIRYNQVACDMFEDTASDSLADAESTGNAGLRYDTGSNSFQYNWDTPSTAGCYRFVVTLRDGSDMIAWFRLN